MFLLQRGLAAGITIYAPAIILSTVLHWRTDATILLDGPGGRSSTRRPGGSEAVNVTQKYQLGVIFCGMLAAFVVLLTQAAARSWGSSRRPGPGRRLPQARRASTSRSTSNRRYTFWSGLLGGFFLALSYFGTDQSQVQRYLSGASLRESRLGLMFNAVFKIPMQFFILLLGALVFVFYQFEPPPVFFNQAAWESGLRARHRAIDCGPRAAVRRGPRREAASRRGLARRAARRRPLGRGRRHAAGPWPPSDRSEAVRAEAKAALESLSPRAKANDTDYVFITFILRHLPHGLIGLLIAAFFAATLSSKAAELNALASTTTVDFYRVLVQRGATDAHLRQPPRSGSPCSGAWSRSASPCSPTWRRT